MLSGIQLAELGGDLRISRRFRQAQLQGILFLFHLFLIIIVQHWQGTLAVLAESNLLAVLLQHDGIIIGSNVHQANLKQFALGDGRTSLTLHKQFGVLTRLQNVKPCAHHLQTAELILLLTACG